MLDNVSPLIRNFATYCGAQQYHFSVTSCGTSAGGLHAPLWHPVEQQEKEAPCTQHPETHQGQPPTAQTVPLQLLQGKRKNRGCTPVSGSSTNSTLGNEVKWRRGIPSPPLPLCWGSSGLPSPCCRIVCQAPPSVTADVTETFEGKHGGKKTDVPGGVTRCFQGISGRAASYGKGCLSFIQFFTICVIL